MWLNRRRVADGVKLALSMPPLDIPLAGASDAADGKPGLSAAVDWLDPRRVVGGVGQAVSVSPLEDPVPTCLPG